MNKTKYLQTDSRWGGLVYPRSPYFIRGCGCGEVAICNCIIEMDKYKAYTPATIQPYCRQYADPNGNGTYWSGIPAMMKHYGMTEVQEHATMSSLWKELAKGGRVAIYLMGAKPGGSKRVHWTSGGHYVCSVDFKYVGSEPYVYMKDSYSNSSLRNGWMSYSGNLKGDVVKVWSGKLAVKPAYVPKTAYKGKLPTKTLKKGDRGAQVKYMKDFLKWRYNYTFSNDVFGSGTEKAVKQFQEKNAKKYGLACDGVWGPATRKAAKDIVDIYAKKYPDKTIRDKICATAKEIANSGKYRYKFYTEQYGRECAICYPHGGANPGWNCIGYAWATWHHSGIPSRCSCDVINDMMYEKILNFTNYSDALAYTKQRLGIDDVTILRAHAGISMSDLKPGDVIAYFSGGTYVHTAVYVGNGKIADCTSSRTPGIKYGVPSYTNWTIKLAFRYTGK